MGAIHTVLILIATRRSDGRHFTVFSVLHRSGIEIGDAGIVNSALAGIVNCNHALDPQIIDHFSGRLGRHRHLIRLRGKSGSGDRGSPDSLD